MLYFALLFGGVFELSAGRSYLHNAIDLTHPVDTGITRTWPTNTPFVFKVVHRGKMQSGDLYYETNSFEQNEHTGTHLDAPAHFSEGKWRTGDIPFERLAGPAIVVDVTRQAAQDHDYQMSVDDLKSWEAVNGQIPDGAVVVMNSGWGQFYSNITRYFGYPAGVYEANPRDVENLHFPGIHPAAAQWLVEHRSIVGVAVDTPSTDHGQSRDFETHQILGHANVWGLENLANADQLPAKGYTLVNMVYKLLQGSGGPARVFAVPSVDEGRCASTADRVTSSLVLCVMFAVSICYQICE